jgi:hypothetical protein
MKELAKGIRGLQKGLSSEGKYNVAYQFLPSKVTFLL